MSALQTIPAVSVLATIGLVTASWGSTTSNGFTGLQPLTTQSITGWLVDDNHSTTILIKTKPIVPDARTKVSSITTTAERIRTAYEVSGLTWDQIAKYFGVSRRAVHLWAAGGRMSTNNIELLTHLETILGNFEGLDRDKIRALLLHSESGLNLIDTERARRSSTPIDINRPPATGVMDEA